VTQVFVVIHARLSHAMHETDRRGGLRWDRGEGGHRPPLLTSTPRKALTV